MDNDASKGKVTEKLSPQEIAVLRATSNSKLSEQEIQDVYARFMSFCPSGKIPREKFRELTKAFIDPGDTKGRTADVVFNVLDKNHDNVIDFSEFLAISVTKVGLDLDTKLDLGFGLLDVSNDGYVTYDEILKFLGFGQKILRSKNEDLLIDQTAKQLFKQFGLEQNQKLSKQQFIEACKTTPELNRIFAQR